MPYTSVEAQVMDHLTQHIASLSWVRTVSWQKPRISASDYRAEECPVVQIVADSQTFTPERNDMTVRWRIFTEVVLCSEIVGQVDQYQLLEKVDDLFKHIGSNFRLGGQIPGVMQIIPVAGTNELHMIEPFYVGVIEWEVMFRKYYTHPC